MTQAAGAPKDDEARRADAAESRERILDAAASLRGDTRLTMLEIAAAAGVGRSTVYRHFPNQAAIRRALDERERLGGASRRAAWRTCPSVSPGRLGRDRPRRSK